MISEKGLTNHLQPGRFSLERTELFCQAAESWKLSQKCGKYGYLDKIWKKTDFVWECNQFLNKIAVSGAMISGR